MSNLSDIPSLAIPDMSEQAVSGATTGDNDESVLLDPSAAMARRIEDKVRAGLQVEHFDIADTSGNCGSSYSVTIVSPNFAKKLPLARHKMVNQILSEEIPQLHAFSQKTLTPEQWAKERS